MRNKFFIPMLATVLFAIAAPSYALPTTCPTIDALQAAAPDLRMIKDTGMNEWYALLNHRFGTDDTWTFVIGNFRAEQESKAHENAVAAVGRLHLFSGPLHDDSQGRTDCDYMSNDGKMAKAITPVVDLQQ